jgi:leucyl/phenylalanyl-tRNA---protein transferase
LGRDSGRDVVALGEDFRPGTLLTAYRAGIFPWPHGDPGDEDFAVLWFCPNPRAIFPLETSPRWSRSLRRTLRIHPFEVTVDQDFEGVVRACGETRESTWITPELTAGYVSLHRHGFAHSVEVWERPPNGGDRALVGGIYGVTVGSVFCGESMFHTRTDASKIAFASLVSVLRGCNYKLFDVQVMNPHLASLGCVPVPRSEYLRRLAAAPTAPVPFVRH